MIITCPECQRILNTLCFKDVFDPDTGGWERLIDCYYCGYEELKELKKQEIPF